MLKNLILFYKFVLRTHTIFSLIAVKCFRFVFIVPVLVLFFSCSVAQKVSLNDSSVIMEGGKSYLIHVVEKKETLYAISKKYNISIDSLKLINPFINDGLKAGQLLKIPVVSSAVSSNEVLTVKEAGKTSEHIVEKGETLYSISQKYSVSLNTLLELNPEIKGGVISPGQALKLPAASRKEHAVPQEVVLSSDTTFIPFSGKARIGIILPLNLNHIRDTLTDLAMESLTAEQLMGTKTINAINFYEGMKMAFDSLSKGMNAEIRIFDAGIDSAGLKKLLEQKELLQMDLLVCPVYFSGVQLLVKLVSQHKVPLITASPVAAQLVKDHPNLYSVSASAAVQCKRMAEYLAGHFGKGRYIIVYAGTASKEKDLGAVFKKNINALVPESDKNPVKEITYGTQGISAVRNELSKTEKNIIIVPSSNSSFVVDFLAKLVNDTAGHDITVAGLPTWLDFETIDLDYLHALHVHVFSDISVNYEDSLVKIFRFNFRERYATEPLDAAIEGFDLTFFLSNVLMKYGKNFKAGLTAVKYKGMHTHYNLEPSESETGGLENNYISILKYEDYDLKKVND